MSLGYYNGALKVGLLEKEHLTSTNNMRLYIYYKPTDDTSKSVTVRLPPLPSGSVIQNIDMSSHPDLDNEDWVVAVKFNGPQVKLYRPACLTESTWTNVKAMPRSINTSSSLMYSKKDRRFYVPTPGSDYLNSLDPNSKENDHPEFVDMWPDYLPDEHLDHDVDEMNSCTTTVHFVEGASGEQFFVEWFFKDQLEIDDKGLEKVTRRTRQFMVFKAEDHPTTEHCKKLSYTEDIGDFCIFLGQGEPFSVRASLHPGLRANCIYFARYNFGVYNITTRCCNIFYTKFYNKGSVPLRSSEFPYWPHPFTLDS